MGEDVDGVVVVTFVVVVVGCIGGRVVDVVVTFVVVVVGGRGGNDDDVGVDVVVDGTGTEVVVEGETRPSSVSWRVWMSSKVSSASLHVRPTTVLLVHAITEDIMSNMRLRDWRNFILLAFSWLYFWEDTTCVYFLIIRCAGS